MCLSLLCHRVKGLGYCVTGVTLTKVKSWETDGTLTYTLKHTLPHTFSTPKGTEIYCATQMGIAAACHSHTHVSAAKQMSSKHGAF